MLNEIFLAVFLVVLAMALIGFRGEIVRLCPRTGTVYAALGLPVNLRGLTLANFRTVAANDGFEAVLDVTGEIRNRRRQPMPIPPVELAIRDRQGRVLYSWRAVAAQPRLAARESLAFHARLAAPPAAGQTVLIRFAPEPPLTLAALWRKLARRL